MAYVCSGRKDTGLVFPRLEIRDLNENYPEQYSLFVLGLMGVQYPNAAIPLMPADFRAAKLLPPGADYFSIGGIHGIPYERWPGDPPTGMLNEEGAWLSIVYHRTARCLIPDQRTTRRCRRPLVVR